MDNKSHQAQIAKTIAPLGPIDRSGICNVPNSPATNLITEILGAREDVADLPDRKRQVGHETKIEVKEKGQQRQIILNTTKEKIIVKIEDIKTLAGTNIAAKKLFVFVLIKANEQAIHAGELTKGYVSFRLQELIDIGLYSTPQSARKGFRDAMESLSSIKIYGDIQITKKRKISIDTPQKLFVNNEISNGQCTIYLNCDINWDFVLQYYTILPRYYFRLPNRASDLLYYICYLARQNTKKIAEQGYYTISTRAIQHRLFLPSEVNNINPQRTIKQPIKDAINELMMEHSNRYGTTELRLELIYNEKGNITDFLENGYLKVRITGDFAEPFMAISRNTANRIEAAQKRQTSIVDRALVKNMTKKLQATGC